MSNVLTRIIESKYQHIEQLKMRFPEQSLQPKLSSRSLYDALNKDNTGFILECKKASPSKGLIRNDFDVKAIASIYADYAAAISVLTDEAFFMGNMDYIPKVKAKVSQPVLCKDFFISPYQVKLAAHQGADAILLMLSVLNDSEYQALANEAINYQLDVLTEVSNEQEVSRAIKLKAKIIGINNRNLRDLTTNLTTTEKLVKLIPDNTVIVSESGIYNHQDVKRLSSLVSGFLVGSSLMAEKELDLACRKLIFGENKVCGITRVEDLNYAAEVGSVYGGLIFAPNTPRAISLEDAITLIKSHRQQKKQAHIIGIFVNQAAELIAQYAQKLSLFAVQLHGQETNQEVDVLRQKLNELNPDTQIWKAIAIDVESDDLTDLPIEKTSNIDRYVYDSKNASQFGGTGKMFNWQLQLPQKSSSMLAGGLTADNADIASQQGFLGLDLNSGIESAAGIKNKALVKKTFDELRNY